MGLRSTAMSVKVNVDSEIEVVADPVQLQQVFLNLIRNAVEAMAGEKKQELRVGASLVDGEVEIRVTDSGHGIEEEKRARLFDPFYSTKDEGMGIGLSVCRTIVEAHNGRIWAENVQGGGAVFVMRLPGKKAE